MPHQLSGLKAILYYRSAHVLLGLGVPILPRMLTEYAHSVQHPEIPLE